MDTELRESLDANRDDLVRQYELAGISEQAVKDYVLREMAIASQTRDWDAWYTLFGMTCSIANPEIKADTLNNLLVMPDHQLHQPVTREIQRLRSPSSIPYIRQVLESKFAFLEYTCSEHGAIAKWFSHALAAINTPEAIDLIKHFAKSDDVEIAEEMAYRLEQLHAERLRRSAKC